MRPDDCCDAAVIGAGPAGAIAARKLAEGGARVRIFDGSHPREKPCGGGISARARTMFPELDGLVAEGKTGTSVRLVSPSGRVLTVTGRDRTFAVDRAVLDSYLLQIAVRAGALHEPNRVSDVERDGNEWSVRCGNRIFRARILVGADGVLSLVRRLLIGNTPGKHLAFGAHVIVENLDPPSALIRFFGDRRGFAWVFNRKTCSSVGIGMPLAHCGDRREILERFFREQARDRPMPRVRSWLLPQASDGDAWSPKMSGEDWCVVGDAAGHADPLTGEGILYAMWGGALAADAILAGRPDRYDGAWRAAFLDRFARHLRLSSILPHRIAVEAILAAGALPFIGRRIFGALASED